MSRAGELLGRVTRRGLGRDSVTLMTGWLLRIALQAAYFVVVARSLGVADYGAFSAVLALTALLVPFSSLGTGNLLLRHIRRDPSLAGAQFVTAVQVTCLSGIAITVLLVVTGNWLAPASLPLLVLLLVGLADLVFARLLDVVAFAYMAIGQARRAATLPLVLMGVRLISAGLLVAGPWKPSPLSWSVLYLAATAPVGVALTSLARRRLGTGAADLRGFAGEWREGILFSISVSAQSVYNDIDKAMLGKLATLEATGLYSVAYRIVDVSFSPLRGLLSASYPRFFDHQHLGMRATLRFTRRLARPAFALGAAASVCLFLGAPLVPHILGPGYAQSVNALRGLALLPLLKVGHYLPADTLTGAGYQGRRTTAQIGVALFNVAINFVLIPAYSWRGAVVASLVSDGLLAVLLWSLILVTARTEARA